MPRLRRATRFATILAGLLVSSSAWAANERWYMMHGCHLLESADDPYDNWNQNQYGSINLSTLPASDPNAYLGLHCPQPHLLGNNGYDASSAKVLDRSNVADVGGYLCRNQGTDGSEICDFNITSGYSDPALTLAFPASVDGTRSYYYWRFVIPPYDPTGWYSGVVSMYFDDN